MKHKWLEEVGVNSYPDNSYNSLRSLKDIYRHIRCKINKIKTGVDERDLWNFDHYYYMWLYEHLMQYKQDASKIVDLNYYKFTYKDKDYTELELINYLCDKLKEIILWDEFKGVDYSKDSIEFTDNEDGTRSIIDTRSEEDKNEFSKILTDNWNNHQSLKDEIFDLWKMLIDSTWW